MRLIYQTTVRFVFCSLLTGAKYIEPTFLGHPVSHSMPMLTALLKNRRAEAKTSLGLSDRNIPGRHRIGQGRPPSGAGHFFVGYPVATTPLVEVPDSHTNPTQTLPEIRGLVTSQVGIPQPERVVPDNAHVQAGRALPAPQARVGGSNWVQAHQVT